MAFTDIVHTGGTMTLDRGDVLSFVDIIYGNAEMYFPLVTSGGGGGGLAVRVIGSPIIKTIRVGR